MKYRYNVQICGVVDYEDRASLLTAIDGKLTDIENLTLVRKSIDVWHDGGTPKVTDEGLYTFTIQLGAVILADDSASVEAIINAFCEAYPEFTLTYQNVEAWQDGEGGLKQYNDDGTEYVESTDDSDDDDDEVEDETAG